MKIELRMYRCLIPDTPIDSNFCFEILLLLLLFKNDLYPHNCTDNKYSIAVTIGNYTINMNVQNIKFRDSGHKSINHNTYYIST